MPLSLSGTGNLQSMSKIVVTNAIDNVEPVAVMKELVTTYDIPAGHYQVSVPIWDRMSAAALTEGVDLFSPTVVAATVRNVPASEHGILTFVSDRLQHQNNEDVLAQIGVQHGNALGRLMDDDLLVLVDGFSLSAPGAGLAATFLHITGAISQLNSAQSTTFGPVPSQPNCVLNPEQIRRMVQEVAGMQAGTTTGMSANPIPTGISEDVIKRYWRGNDALFGVPIFMDGNIAIDGSGDSKGGVFAREALALAMEQEVRVGDEPDISLRGTEIVSVGVWGELEIVDQWGVEIYSAADHLYV